jgi:outer membrane immunogenic protein
MAFVKRFGIAVGVMGAFVSAASAADISEPISGFDWSGAYIGAHGGYAWGEADVSYEGEPGGGDLDGGFWGGALAGYNLQHDAIVFGVEGDFGIGDVSGKGDPKPLPTEETYDYSYDLDWNAHLRARAGFAVDRALFFVAGGLAAASHTLGVEETTGGLICPAGPNPCLQAITPDTVSLGEDSKTHIGFTVGGGVEFALTDNVLLRAEYLYDSYGEESYEDEEGNEYDVDLTAQTVRAAVSFKF